MMNLSDIEGTKPHNPKENFSTRKPVTLCNRDSKSELIERRKNDKPLLLLDSPMLIKIQRLIFQARYFLKKSFILN